MKHPFLLLIFSLLVTVSKAQLIDNFADGNFTSNPLWIGDVASFQVNTDMTLQLNAATSGSAFIATPIQLNFGDTVEWRIRAKLAFAPSSSNYCRIYLSADTSNPQLPLNGYFLQLGESLSNDAIELFRQAGTVITSVCRGPDAQIAAAFDLYIRVVRLPNGNWVIYSNTNGSLNYNQIASGFDNGNPLPRFFMMDCNFTSGNIHGFYFDDIYAGNFIQDHIPPYCNDIALLNDSSVSVLFSEKLDFSTTSILANYNINTVGSPSQLIVDSINDYRITLFFPQHFISRTNYSLSIQNLKDRSGNQMSDTLLHFAFFPVGIGEENDIVISEVYFELASTSPLPNAEFIELYNRSDSAINLLNWSLTDGSTSATFPDRQINPHQYVLVYDQQNESLFTGFNDRIGIVGFPGLNNDVGDSLTLFDASNSVIEKIHFNDDSYHDSNKKNGGWTIERIDQNFTCINESNWKASENSFHGTPGFQNSVEGLFVDNTAPFLKNLFVIDSLHLQIDFSESIFSTIIPGNFVSIDRNNVINNCISVQELSATSFELTFGNQFSNEKNYLIIQDSLTDCALNVVDRIVKYPFGQNEKALPGDILINEILFDPFSGGKDFVEFFNRSGKIIDLKNWIIQETGYDDQDVIKEEAIISSDHLTIFPGEYLVFTESPKTILDTYFSPNPQKILPLSKMPDFNADEGQIVLRDDFGALINNARYSQKQQFYLLNSPKGVSLERLNSSGSLNDSAYWHSAASSVGFATPAYRNSHSVSETNSEKNLSVEQEVFSPDNNGYNDLLAINYHFSAPGTLLTVGIFSKEGIPIRTLLQDQTVGDEGQIFWDGFTDDGRLVLPGRYLIQARSFNLNGETNYFHTSCVMAMKR